MGVFAAVPYSCTNQQEKGRKCQHPRPGKRSIYAEERKQTVAQHHTLLRFVSYLPLFVRDLSRHTFLVLWRGEMQSSTISAHDRTMSMSMLLPGLALHCVHRSSQIAVIKKVVRERRKGENTRKDLLGFIILQ